MNLIGALALSAIRVEFLEAPENTMPDSSAHALGMSNVFWLEPSSPDKILVPLSVYEEAGSK
jgi:hypothetical protein